MKCKQCNKKNRLSHHKFCSQKCYWKNLESIRGKDAPNWRGENVRKETKHQWLTQNYGRPAYCSRKLCKGKSKIFEWCLRRGRTYTHNPKDYIWLCRSCHRKYDMTPEKLEQMIINIRKTRPNYATK